MHKTSAVLPKYLNDVLEPISGLHLGNDSRGAKYGFMRVRGGNGVKIRVRKHMTSRGSMPPRKFLYFRLSQIASDTFSGT